MASTMIPSLKGVGADLGNLGVDPGCEPDEFAADTGLTVTDANAHQFVPCCGYSVNPLKVLLTVARGEIESAVVLLVFDTSAFH